MASLYQAIGKYEDSLSCVDRLLVYLPEDLLLRERRAQLLLHTGEIEDCLNECLAMLGRDQNCVGAHRVAALAYSLDGDIEKAIEHYEETLRLDPTDDEALSNYASILLEQENPDRAYELAEQALSFNRKNAHAWLVLAVILSDRGRVAEAVVRFERSLELNPKQARGYLQYGRTLVRLERYEEAIRAFRKAKELDPELGDVLDRLIREAKGE
ncbi:MAG: tetratricopeptide repeat protein, partial [Planctomycetota bacterium]|nr:tetratricopeptide repeat protein [Planctomycetota bacterium]